jgi:hypothetical protein
MAQHPPARPRRAWLPLAALLLIGGCGMYGDLYLEEPEAPGPPEVEERPPIVTEPAPAAQPGEEQQADKPKPPPQDEPGATGRL